MLYLAPLSHNKPTSVKDGRTDDNLILSVTVT